MDGWIFGVRMNNRENAGGKSPFIVSHLKGSIPLHVVPGSLGRGGSFCSSYNCH